MNKEHQKKHDDNQGLIQKLAVRIEQLENQTKANSKSISIRKRYAITKVKQFNSRLDELTTRLSNRISMPVLIPCESVEVIDEAPAQSSVVPPEEDKDTQGDL